MCFIFLLVVCALLSHAAGMQGGDIVPSSYVHTSVCMYVCVYVTTLQHCVGGSLLFRHFSFNLYRLCIYTNFLVSAAVYCEVDYW